MAGEEVERSGAIERYGVEAVPPELRTTPWRDLATIHFVHRWFALAVLLVALLVYRRARAAAGGEALRRGSLALVLLLLVQALLGIATVVLGVPIAVALAHQGNAVLLFAVTVYLVVLLRAAEAVRV